MIPYFSSMSNPFHNELKKEFQLERMILFSDAVFAIAITLLAIELKVPEVEKHLVSDALLIEKLEELIPKFIGFFVSFFVIGVYWVVHHRTFGYVINYNHRLLWLNLIFLLGVVLMPFSSAFYSSYVIRGVKLPVIIYVLNIFFLGIMSLVVWEYVINPKRGLAEGVTVQLKRYFRFRAIAPLVVFSFITLVYVYKGPNVAVWMPLLIAPLMRLGRRYYFKPQPAKK